MGLQIIILTEMIVALGVLVLLGSIVDLPIFPKNVMKSIANMHRKHDVSCFQIIFQKIVGQFFCQNIASLKIGEHSIVKNVKKKSEHRSPLGGPVAGGQSLSYIPSYMSLFVQPAREAQGLLLADGAPTEGRGKTF